jgi:uncharacterized protein (DUF2267 family)
MSDRIAHPAVDYAQFISLVARRAQIPNDEAELAAGAVLETLAERLTPGEVTQLLEQLPMEVAVWFHRVPGRAVQRYDVDEFLRRVAQREGTDVATAESHARAVFAALREVVSGDEIQDVLADLPEDFRAIVLNEAVTPAEEFVSEVARQSAVEETEASRAVEAVLETLGERLPGGEVHDLIGRLPVQLHEPLKRGAARNNGDAMRMSAEAFVARVAERAGVGDEAARRYVRAVMAALRGAIGGEEFSDVQVELLPDYSPLIPMP